MTTTKTTMMRRLHLGLGFRHRRRGWRAAPVLDTEERAEPHREQRGGAAVARSASAWPPLPDLPIGIRLGQRS